MVLPHQMKDPRCISVVGNLEHALDSSVSPSALTAVCTLPLKAPVKYPQHLRRSRMLAAYNYAPFQSLFIDIFNNFVYFSNRPSVTDGATRGPRKPNLAA